MLGRFAPVPGPSRVRSSSPHQLAFDLRAASRTCRSRRCRPGHTPMSWLRQLCAATARRSGTPKRTAADARGAARPRAGGDRETSDFPGYFLIVRDIVKFARDRGHPVPGPRHRRRTPRSATRCKITAVDSGLVRAAVRAVPVRRAATRSPTSTSTSTPTAARRSSSTSTRSTAGATRRRSPTSSPTGPKSAVRDMAKALGYSAGQQDAWSKSRSTSWARSASHDADARRSPRPWSNWPSDLLKAPRHLGIHSGGMVLTDRPVGEVCPVERGRMEGRTVLQWDKDDCAWMGLVKFDLLGLGMLAALQLLLRPRRASTAASLDLDTIPEGGARRLRPALPGRHRRRLPGREPRADGHAAAAASRAASTTSSSRSRSSGPARSRARPCTRTCAARPGEEPVTYPHPDARAGAQADARGAAVPGAADADRDGCRRLHAATTPTCCVARWAPSAASRRSVALSAKLYDGMAAHGITGDLADDIYDEDRGLRELRLRREPPHQLRASSSMPAPG